MIFNYQKITPIISRPIIPVFLKSKNKFIFYHALIDSGADYCIFGIELADALGIKLSKRKVTFKGVSKDKVQGYWGEVEIRIGGVSYKTRAIFAEISDFGHGILGQKGFFNIFIVKFDLIKEEIELEERKNVYMKN